MIKRCIVCKSILTGRKMKFCSRKCTDKDYYNKNSDRIISKTRKWDMENPEKKRKINKKALDKFRKEKPERFNELMRNNYKRNKNKFNCRNKTRAILNGIVIKKYNPLKLQCSCGSIKNLEIHHEVYPKTSKEIRRAIDDGKIYYKCRKCHRNA